MSDIGFHGLAAVAVGLLMLAVAALALAVEVLLWWRRSRAGTRSPGALPFVAPLCYAALALAIIVAVEQGGIELDGVMDRAAPVVAAIALPVWLGARILVARAGTARARRSAAGDQPSHQP